MTSKKLAASKRAKIPRAANYAKSFAKVWERLSASGRYDMTKLKEVIMLLIANDAPLSADWKDHALTGDWKGHRECHVGGDFLLIYTIDEEPKIPVIIFVRTGTHAELFE